MQTAASESNQSQISTDGVSFVEGHPLYRRPRLRPKDAASYLDDVHGVVVAVPTLAKYRSIGGGPSFQKQGRAVLYPRAELDAWVASRLTATVKSTSA